MGRKTVWSNFSPNVSHAWEELKQAIVKIYGERLSGVYLFGSYARGYFIRTSHKFLEVFNDLKYNIFLWKPFGFSWLWLT
jgi:hypothetical protein